MMKRFLSCILCLLLVITTIPVIKASASSYEVTPYLENVQLNAPIYSGCEAVDSYVRNIIASETTNDMTNAEKLHAVYSYLVWNFSYGYSTTYPTLGNQKYNVDTNLICLAYSLFKTGVGQCNNYSAAMVLLSLALGYEAKMFFGKYIANSGSTAQHYFSCIKIDGYWWPFDAQIGCQQYTDEGWFGMSPDCAGYHYYSAEFDFAAQGERFEGLDYDFIYDYWRETNKFELNVQGPNPDIPVRIGDELSFHITTSKKIYGFAVHYLSYYNEFDEEDCSFTNANWWDVYGDSKYFDEEYEDTADFTVQTSESDRFWNFSNQDDDVYSIAFIGYGDYCSVGTALYYNVLSADDFAKLQKGDMNGDGELRAADARLLLRAAAGLEKLTNSQNELGDANGDGFTRADDAKLVLEICACIRDM